MGRRRFGGPSFAAMQRLARDYTSIYVEPDRYTVCANFSFVLCFLPAYFGPSMLSHSKAGIAQKRGRNLSLISKNLVALCTVRSNGFGVEPSAPPDQTAVRISERPPSGICVRAGCCTNVRYWPKADMGLCAANVRFSGVKRTCRFALHMSAFDPKRTSALIPTRGPVAKC